MSNELVERSMIESFDDVSRMANAMARSRYFSEGNVDAGQETAQAIVKILAGQEMGIGPFAAMSGIHVIHGKPSLGANIMAAAVKAHPKYDYRVKTMQNELVEIIFYEDGEELGISAFSKADATAASTQNMGKFPRNMLFARAISNGIRWYCPDVFYGNSVYATGEIEEIAPAPAQKVVNFETGEVLDGEILDVEVVETTPATTQPERYTPEQLRAVFNNHINEYMTKGYDVLSVADRKAKVKAAAIALGSCFDKDKAKARHAVQGYLLSVESLNEASDAELYVIHQWCRKGKDGVVKPAVIAEARAVFALTQKAA
jgi:hypothetical protein